jgi:hypothetical protein
MHAGGPCGSVPGIPAAFLFLHARFSGIVLPFGTRVNETVPRIRLHMKNLLTYASPKIAREILG